MVHYPHSEGKIDNTRNGVNWTDQRTTQSTRRKNQIIYGKSRKQSHVSLREPSRVESNAGLNRTIKSRAVKHRAVQMSAALGVT